MSGIPNSVPCRRAQRARTARYL